MDTPVDQETRDFAALVLEHYDPAVLKEKSDQVYSGKVEMQRRQEEELRQRAGRSEKYSIDYSRFGGITDEATSLSKEEEYQKMAKQNPYLQAMGCNNDRRKERQLYEKSTQEKLEAVETFKAQGNSAMKRKEFSEAGYFYEHALVQFDYTFPESPADESRCALLKEQVHNNMAMVQMQLGLNEKALHHLGQVLQENPGNIKALYRQAQIKYQQDHFSESLALVHQIFALCPEHPETKVLQQKVLQKEEAYRERQKEMSVKMFS